MTALVEGALSEIPDRLVVSPGFGRFLHRRPSVVTAEGELVHRGQTLGDLETSTGLVAVTAPQDAWVMAFLVRDGERVRPGHPIVHLRVL